MQIRTLVLMAVSVLLTAEAAFGESRAQAESWKEWQVKGKALLDASQLESACDAFRHALLEAAHARVSPEELLNLHASLASAYTLGGRYAEATVEFRRTLELERTLRGAQSLEYAMVYGNLSMLPTQTEDRERGIALLRESIEGNAATDQQAELVSAKDCLAKLLYQKERLSEAERVLVEARASAAGDQTEPVWIRAELLNDLGAVREKQRRYAEAAQLDAEMLSLIESTFGKDSFAVVAPLNNLATANAQMGKLAEAVELFQRAREVCLQTLGASHPTYAALLANDAAVLRKMGRKKESKLLLAEADEILAASNRRNGVGATVSLEGLRASR